MKEPTFETVNGWNGRYNSEHFFNKSDYEKCLELKRAIESTRDNITPKPGDILEYTDEHGYHYCNAHIEKKEGNKFTICERPSEPFTAIQNNGEIYTHTSGGAWTGAKKSELTLIGQREKRFWQWGSSGPCRNGGITTIATVNVWRLNRRAKEWRKYTTEDFDLIHVSDRGKPDPESGYRFFATNNAWKTQEELDQFLNCFKAVEEPYGTWPTCKKYWLFKKENHWIYTKEEFDKIQAKEETSLFNGRMRPTKFIYKGTTALCYVDRPDEIGTVEFLKSIGEL